MLTDAEIIADLIRVGTGEIQHLFRDECPSCSASYNDTDWRDHECPACIAITRGEGLLNQAIRERTACAQIITDAAVAAANAGDADEWLSWYQLGARLGDADEWLSWYQLENDMGRKQHEAGPSDDMRPICNLEDLLWVIEAIE